MDTLTYAEKLTDPRWKVKRIEILKRDDFKCRECGHNDSTLNVHHIIYINGKEPWDYDNNFLITLCEKCHEIEHAFMKENIPQQISESLVRMSNLPLTKLQYALHYMVDWGYEEKKDTWEILFDSMVALKSFIDLKHN